MASQSPKLPPEWHYFASIPWCARHLHQDDLVPWTPNYGQSASNHVKQWNPVITTNIHDNLWRRVLTRADAVSAFLCLYRQPSDPNQPVQEMRSFINLEWAVTGYDGVAHGGMTTVIFDEILGLHGSLNYELGRINHLHMTLKLTTTFIKPIKVPCTIMVVSRIDKQENRKLFLIGEIQDEHENVLATAEGLFIGVHPKL